MGFYSTFVREIAPEAAGLLRKARVRLLPPRAPSQILQRALLHCRKRLEQDPEPWVGGSLLESIHEQSSIDELAQITLGYLDFAAMRLSGKPSWGLAVEEIGLEPLLYEAVRLAREGETSLSAQPQDSG